MGQCGLQFLCLSHVRVGAESSTLMVVSETDCPVHYRTGIPELPCRSIGNQKRCWPLSTRCAGRGLRDRVLGKSVMSPNPFPIYSSFLGRFYFTGLSPQLGTVPSAFIPAQRSSGDRLKPQSPREAFMSTCASPSTPSHLRPDSLQLSVESRPWSSGPLGWE